MRHDIHHALDGMHGLGHPEGAAVGNTARRLVGIDPVDLDMGRLEVVGASADVEQAGGKFGGIGRRIGVAVIGERFNAQRRELCRPVAPPTRR